MLQADLLDSVSETKYLSADNYRVYRTIMRIFYLEHQKMHYQMDRDTVLILLREQAVFAQFRTPASPVPSPSSKTGSFNT